MPGIVGFLSKSLTKDIQKDTVKRMQDLITHIIFYGIGLAENTQQNWLTIQTGLDKILQDLF